MPVWDPADYHQHSASQQSWARELISKLALTGAERVLDLGCGDGKVTAEIAAQLPRGRVVGIDGAAGDGAHPAARGIFGAAGLLILEVLMPGGGELLRRL